MYPFFYVSRIKGLSQCINEIIWQHTNFVFAYLRLSLIVLLFVEVIQFAARTFNKHNGFPSVDLFYFYFGKTKTLTSLFNIFSVYLIYRTVYKNIFFIIPNCKK